MYDTKLFYMTAVGMLTASISCFAGPAKRTYSQPVMKDAIAASCGGEKKWNECRMKRPNFASVVVQDGFQLQFSDVELAEEVVKFANGPCACMGGSDAEIKREINFAKTKLPAMLKKAKAEAAEVNAAIEDAAEE